MASRNRQNSPITLRASHNCLCHVCRKIFTVPALSASMHRGERVRLSVTLTLYFAKNCLRLTTQKCKHYRKKLKWFKGVPQGSTLGQVILYTPSRGSACNRGKLQSVAHLFPYSSVSLVIKAIIAFFFVML